jgi:propionyl-CoA carboxylase beta chain
VSEPGEGYPIVYWHIDLPVFLAGLPATITIRDVTEQKRPGLSPVRRTPPEVKPVPPDTLESNPSSVSEQRLDHFRKRRYEVLHSDSEAARKRRGQGRPEARERIAALLDSNSFVELDMFATTRATDFGMAEKRAPGDGVVAGYGTISGREVAVYAYDPTIVGGSLGEVGAEKIVKVQELALRNRIPIIGINDSGGARIQEGVVALAGYSAIFYRNVRSSGVIPQLSVIAGPCTGGAVYSPAITDFIFIVNNTGYMFITGPEVIRVTTGENVSFDELGGGEVHNSRSGVAHFLAENETACWEGVRRLLSYLPSHHGEPPPVKPTDDDVERADPELQSLVPDSPNLPYDMREVISRVLDDREFLEVQPFFAPNIVTGLGRLGGHTVGLVGNQPKVLAGAIDIKASVKAARFIRFCDAFNIPIISLVDVPGYLPGTAQEHEGIIRHGAKLLFAYAEASVPKLTVITRKDYGGAYCVMSPKQMGADLNLAWPTAEIAVMGPEAAVNVVYRRELASASDPDQRRKELVAKYITKFANPWVAAERGYVDGVIEPKQTRRELIRGLQLCLRKTVDRPPGKHGNIPL